VESKDFSLAEFLGYDDSDIAETDPQVALSGHENEINMLYTQSD